MKSPLYATQPADTSSEVMDECQAALFLGVSTKSLRKLRQQNLIPHAYVGGLIRYVRSVLIEWLKAGGSNESKGNE